MRSRYCSNCGGFIFGRETRWCSCCVKAATIGGVGTAILTIVVSFVLFYFM